MLVVDDSSPDGTGKLADRLAEPHEWLHVLHREAKEGLGRAYLAGFAWALARPYSHVLEMDCDLSHPPEALPAMLIAAADADLVLGSRYVRGGGVEGTGRPRARDLTGRLPVCAADARRRCATSPGASSASAGGCSSRST